ncbi:hypothetical protein D3C76_1731860 [compost metagenome]
MSDVGLYRIIAGVIMAAVPRLIGPDAGAVVVGTLVGEAADHTHTRQAVGRIGDKIGGDGQ